MMLCMQKERGVETTHVVDLQQMQIPYVICAVCCEDSQKEDKLTENNEDSSILSFVCVIISYQKLMRSKRTIRLKLACHLD